MAYIFHQDDLPRLVSVTPGRERTFFVNQELAGIDDVMAGVIRYAKGAASPYHYHINCEHFYFILEGKGTVETDEGIREVQAGDLIFIPAEDKHRLRATEPMFNILVNNLCPGIIDVESWGPRAERMATARGKTVEEVRGAFSGMAMLNRLGRPEEMGWIAAFLVSEKNSYMTGTTVESCGGATKYI